MWGGGSGVGMFRAWEAGGGDVGLVGADGAGDGGTEVDVTLCEFGVEGAAEAEEVRDDQDLGIAVGAGADTDGGDGDFAGDMLGEGCGDSFEDDGEGAGGLEGFGVGEEAFGVGAATALDAHAEGLGALGGEADMGADGDTVLDDTGDGFGADGAAFEFNGVAAGCLEEASGVLEGLLWGELVGHEGHIGEDEGGMVAADDGGGVVDHVFEGDGDGGGMAELGGTDGIADEDEGNFCEFEEMGDLGVVGGEGGEFFDAFHGADDVRGYFFHGGGNPFRVFGEFSGTRLPTGGRLRGGVAWGGGVTIGP